LFSGQIAAKRASMTSGPNNTIATPCKNICVIDTETSECIGCGRTRLEIAGWMRMTTKERQHVMAELDERVATLSKRKKRKGGRRARRQKTSPVIINFKAP
jgi:predicted Fe-S protein YdhL (DUF1289 family)